MYDVQIGEEHPQVQKRSTRTFRDQHGRQWSAVIEQKTGHPVAPPSPKFAAPVYPPSKYVRIAPGDAGDLFIDYTAWHNDLVEAWANYEQRRFDIAHAEYKDNPSEVLANPTPYLLKALGVAPEHPDIPRACLAGNKWILGLADAKPAWAERLFPTPKEESRNPDASEFPDAGEPKDVGGVTYPHNYAPGRWRLSNGDTIQGTRADALDAEAAIAEFATT